MVKKALVLFLGIVFPLAAAAEDSLVKFKGGIGVIPVSNVVGTAATGDATRNVVRNVSPGGQPWVIADLRADVKADGLGSIKVRGKGLLLGGGNNIGRNGGQSVKASLFCGPAATATEHSTDPAVALEPNGNFLIEDTLSPAPPVPCSDAVLLIRSAGGAWFAAGIPKLENDDD